MTDVRLDRPGVRVRPTLGLRDLVQDGDTILIATGVGAPAVLVEELARTVLPVRQGLRLIQVCFPGPELLESLPLSGHVFTAAVPGPITRRAIQDGRAEMLSASMSVMYANIASGALRLDGVLFTGRQVGSRIVPVLTADLLDVAVRSSRFVGVELADGFPVAPTAYSFSQGECDYVVSSRRTPPVVDERRGDRETSAIAAAVGNALPERLTLELGVGQALQGVADVLAGRVVAVHTGLLGPWAMSVNPARSAARSTCRQGRFVAGVAAGGQDFYRWLDANHDVELDSCQHTHDAEHLGGLENFAAVNSAKVVDLQGRPGEVASAGKGVVAGGLPDFARAGAACAGSVIAMKSTFADGATRIVPSVASAALDACDVTHVATEFGLATLKGRGPDERAEAMVRIAHPRHRRGLKESVLANTVGGSRGAH
jgi:acyl-CoA hydrolase